MICLPNGDDVDNGDVLENGYLMEYLLDGIDG